MVSSSASTINHPQLPQLLLLKAVAVPLAQIENCVKRRELSEAETALRQNISQKGNGPQRHQSDDFFLKISWWKWGLNII